MAAWCGGQAACPLQWNPEGMAAAAQLRRKRTPPPMCVPPVYRACTAGKLRIKDVKEAILTKKASLAAQQAALGAVLSEGISEGLHPLERPDIPPDVKAALFRMQLHQAEEAAKKVRRMHACTAACPAAACCRFHWCMTITAATARTEPCCARLALGACVFPVRHLHSCKLTCGGN